MDIFHKFKKEKQKEKQENNSNFIFNSKNAYNARISELFSKYRFLQLISVICLLISVISIAGVIHIGSQSKFVPYIVEVNKLGETVVIGEIRAGTIKDQRIIRAKVASFIKTLRTVSVDPALQRNFIFETYHSLQRGDPAINKANVFYKDKATNPFELGKKINREVEIVSLLEMTPNTYQLDWKEKTYDKSGVLLYIKGYRALVTVYLIPTAVESIEDLIKNPLGIYIKDYSISELNSSENDILNQE
ncbi:VirB8/TrbF family protein [uncultured Brachyspira sp.]|jgi:type IV secretory pathway TrbF-like protein|uniref:VirB8/TrbF family protein n=1 Tax=uncultured Brachyspira sp. TaxID=221953 RepID=UPI002612FDA1|nr:VirB8/TrbF family protein [uncultured Brachyspira sp.]